MTIKWSCFSQNKDKRFILEDFLPCNYDYNVKSFNIIHEDTKIRYETKYTATVDVNVCTEESFSSFLKEFQNISFTFYKTDQHDSKNLKTVLLSGARVCRHSVRKRKSESKNSERENEIAMDKTPGKNTDCNSFLKFKLKKSLEHEHGEHGCHLYPLEFTINFDHNHCVYSASAMKFHPVGKEATEIYTQLMKEGSTPSSAYNSYQDILKEKHRDDYMKMKADRTYNPEYKGNLQIKKINCGHFQTFPKVLRIIFYP